MPSPKRKTQQADTPALELIDDTLYWDPTTGEAVAYFPAPSYDADSPMARFVQTEDLWVRTGLFFETVTRELPALTGGTEPVRQSPTGYAAPGTASRMAEMLAQYLPSMLSVIGVERAAANERFPESQPPLVVVVGNQQGRRASVPAGSIARHLAATTTYDHANSRIEQHPEAVFPLVAAELQRELE